MKSLFLSLLVLFLASAPSLAQERALLECDYNVSVCTDTATRKVSSSVLTLRCGRRSSLFFCKDQWRLDSILNLSNDEQEILSLMGNVRRAAMSCYVLKDSQAGSLSLVDNVGEACLSYREDLPSFAWTLGSDRRVVLGHECRVAHCSFRGRDYVAWFAEDIPVADGPWKFSGLSGLILLAYDLRSDYVFEAVAIRNSSAPIALLPLDYEEVSRADYAWSRRAYDANPLAAFAAAGVSFSRSDGSPARRRNLKFDMMERDL